MLEPVLAISLLNSCILMAFAEWGWLSHYHAVRKKWMPSGECYLCLGLWLTPVTGLVYYCLRANGLEWILIPLCVAPLVAFITNPRS